MGEREEQKASLVRLLEGSDSSISLGNWACTRSWLVSFSVESLYTRKTRKG